MQGSGSPRQDDVAELLCWLHELREGGLHRALIVVQHLPNKIEIRTSTFTSLWTWDGVRANMAHTLKGADIHSNMHRKACSCWWNSLRLTRQRTADLQHVAAALHDVASQPPRQPQVVVHVDKDHEVV